MSCYCNEEFSSQKAAMRFVQYVPKKGGVQVLGLQTKVGGDIIPISDMNREIPCLMRRFIERGDDMITKAKALANDVDSAIPEKDVLILSPITHMDKLACVCLNYAGTFGSEPPTTPVIFSKFSSSVTGAYDSIPLPSMSDNVDWEAELAVVISKRCKNVSQSDAQDCIFGYTVAQDISARDWQKPGKNGGQFLLGKSMDSFCPLGPAIVLKEAIRDAKNLSIKTWVNGVQKQDGNTKDMIFSTQYIISYLSQFVTLLPGDVILTGSPAGVGHTRNPPEYLAKGDILETEIEGIGRLRNKIM